MSLRASASLPSTCSGAMYCTVPEIVPCAVPGEVVASRVDPRHRNRPARRPQLRQPEVQQLRAGLRQHDVGGLEIAMDDALAVRLVERVGDLERAIVSAWSSGSGPFSSRAASVCPSRCGMTR